MKNRYVLLFLMVTLGFCWSNQVDAQQKGSETEDSLEQGNASANGLIYGLNNDKDWRNTAAVFTLSGKELERMPVANLLNTLQGRIPGLTVVSGSGEPGYNNPSLYVRGQSSWNIGANDLLILLDGFQVGIDALSALSTSEVESVSILKDAAATAFYGLQGASGVLLVKTKLGNSNGKKRITFKANYGIQSPLKLPDVADAYTYTSLYNSALQNDNLPIKYMQPDLYRKANDFFHPNVDWYNQILKKTSDIQDYNLSFSAGDKDVKYFVLMDYMNAGGLYKNANIIDKDFGTNAKYTRLNLRANVEIRLSNNLTVKAYLSGVTEDRKTPNGFSGDELFDNMLRIPAASFPVKNPNGTWGNSDVYKFNPIERLRQGGIYTTHTRSLETNFQFKEKLDVITKGLALEGGVSFGNRYQGVYEKHFTVPSYEILKDANDEPILDVNGDVEYKKIGDVSQGISDGGLAHWTRNSGQIGLSYLRSFNKHSFSGIIMAKRYAYIHENERYEIRTQGLSSYFTYDYDKRLVLSLSGAYEGSAGFQKGKKYGLFPAVGAAWVISNEKFFKDNKTIDFLKVRSSIGSSGNINQYFRFLYYQNAYQDDGWIVGSNNEFKNGMRPGSIANENASWEKKTTFDIGVDMKLLKRLSFTFDFFSEQRTGIFEKPSSYYPSFTGFFLPDLNTGIMNNHGFETVISFYGEKHEFTYNVSAMGSFARNKIIAKSEVAQPFDYLYERGYRLNQMRGLVFDGFYEESDFDSNNDLKSGIVKSQYHNVKPGDLKFVDQDANGIINDNDKIPLGYSKLPEITLGLNIELKYKRLDFKTFIQGVMNRTVSLIDDAYNYTHPFVNHNNITAFSLNSWTPQNSNTAESPVLSTLRNANNDQNSDFWLRNGNFLKLRDIEFGYTLPKMKFLKNAGDVRISISGINLFTVDKIKGLEPENLSMGYPLMRTVSLGLKAIF